MNKKTEKAFGKTGVWRRGSRIAAIAGVLVLTAVASVKPALAMETEPAQEEQGGAILNEESGTGVTDPAASISYEIAEEVEPGTEVEESAAVAEAAESAVVAGTEEAAKSSESADVAGTEEAAKASEAAFTGSTSTEIAAVVEPAKEKYRELIYQDNTFKITLKINEKAEIPEDAVLAVRETELQEEQYYGLLEAYADYRSGSYIQKLEELTAVKPVLVTSEGEEIAIPEGSRISLVQILSASDGKGVFTAWCGEKVAPATDPEAENEGALWNPEGACACIKVFITNDVERISEQSVGL